MIPKTATVIHVAREVLSFIAYRVSAWTMMLAESLQSKPPVESQNDNSLAKTSPIANSDGVPTIAKVTGLSPSPFAPSYLLRNRTHAEFIRGDFYDFLRTQEFTRTVHIVTLHRSLGKQDKTVDMRTFNISVADMGTYFFNNPDYRICHQTQSTYEVQKFYQTYLKSWQILYGEIEEFRKKRSNQELEWRKRLEVLKVSDRRCVIATGQFPRPGLRVRRKRKCTLEEAKYQLDKLNSKLRRRRGHARQLASLLDECEERLREEGEVELISERPLIQGRGKRWIEGKRGWVGIKPDDIGSDEDANPSTMPAKPSE